VIGTQLSINLFNSESSLGRTFTFRDQDFTVVGVLKTIDNPINYNSIDFDNAAIINFSIGKTINKDISQIQQINIQADDAKYIQSVVDEVNKKILSNHNGENDFAVLTGDKISQPTSQLFYTAAGLTTAIAAISLLVGGIGIMNIMLVTVAERTREIGIRKALGANNMDITMQFLIESIAISLCGGILGYLLGYVAAFGISTMLTFDPIFSTDILLIALSISLIMGTLFGIYPAFRAASKDPVESLHNYH
jgi:ABC-type antimicrobial peptide transport system permease subunit